MTKLTPPHTGLNLIHYRKSRVPQYTEPGLHTGRLKNLKASVCLLHSPDKQSLKDRLITRRRHPRHPTQNRWGLPSKRPILQECFDGLKWHYGGDNARNGR